MITAPTAKVFELKRRVAPPMAALFEQPSVDESSTAEQHFVAASMFDNGDSRNVDEALANYRRAPAVAKSRYEAGESVRQETID